MTKTITTFLVISLLLFPGCGTEEKPAEIQELPIHLEEIIDEPLPVVETPQNIANPLPQNPTEQPSQQNPTEIQIETNFFSLTFPASWGEVTFMEDFAGFGPSIDGPIQEVGGRKFGFFKQEDLAFQITMIGIQDKDSEYIPEDAILIGETATQLFYAEASGIYSTQDLEEIWETLEIS